MELGSSDVILGMKWLATLGKVQVDWKSLAMRFNVGGMMVTLQGDPSLSKTLVTLKAMMKALKDIGEGVLLELGCFLADCGKFTAVTQGGIKQVLAEFSEVFNDPEGLPPRRTREHAINL